MVKIDNYRVISTGWKHKDRLHLRSATEVHWSGWKYSWAEKRRLHAILSVLPTVPNIRLLSLRDAEINEAQQAIIFGLSTLRTLVVNSCSFYPSKKPLPLSHVTALKLAYTDVETIHRLLTLLATSLESLEVDYSNYSGGPISPTLHGGLIEPLQLSTLTIKAYHIAPNQAILDTFKRYTATTTISILSYYTVSGIFLHHSDLPALRSVTCDHRLAMIIIPERPVTTYMEVGSFRTSEQLDLLNALSKTHARITRLTLSVPDTIQSLLPSLATYLQHLEQLTLRSYTVIPHQPLSGQPPHNPSSLAAVILPKLKWITIWVGHNYSTDFFPDFESLLKEYITPACPALELFEILGIPYDYNFNFNLSPEPVLTWKAWRLPNGSWERQRAPPIPTPSLRRSCKQQHSTFHG